MAVLAARVRDVHAARVRGPLGHPSWESYCQAEFGISRARAYRLLDVARALAAIHGAVAAGTQTSRTRDTGPAAAAALDYGLSRRALTAVSSRADIVAEPDHPPTRHARPQRSPGPRHRHGARRGPPGRPRRPHAATARRSADGPGRRRAAPRTVVDDLAASSHAIGELMLEVAPAYLSDTDATDVLALLCDQIGEPLKHGLAARRYAVSGDRRALHGTVLQIPISATPVSLTAVPLCLPQSWQRLD
ncbi:hypothetical protein ACFVT5_38005 [Streptomyces sp. NPDC058001]|uniref:hypothetical protein n=1 Tax=Streptomyces sp. NPDC058001 TaxID=3346300 RepID=UPI0036EF174F